MVEYAGAIEELNSKQLDFISCVLEKHGFGDAKVTAEPVGKAGDNCYNVICYMLYCYNYTANVKRFVAEKEGKTFKMVVKVAQSNEMLREASDTIHMLLNEYTMYSEVLPKFTELEIAAGIPNNDRLRYATFYGAYMEAPHELILLEDLQESGFVMLDRFDFFDSDTVKLVLNTFARFHSLSYALKDKEPKLFNKLKEKLTNPWTVMTGCEFTKPYYDEIEIDAHSMVESEKHKNVVKGTISQMNKLFENVLKDDNDRYTVIQQGDCWTNNILFTVNNEKPIQCCMIDYQISKVNSPVSDLHYMIFNCTNYKMRSQYMQKWIDYYHSELSKELPKFGLKVNNCFPRTQLDADMKRYAKLSLAFAVIIASLITRSDEDANKMKISSDMQYKSIEDATEAIRIANLDTKTKNLFRARVEGTIDTMFDMGYL